MAKSGSTRGGSRRRKIKKRLSEQTRLEIAVELCKTQSPKATCGKFDVCMTTVYDVIKKYIVVTWTLAPQEPVQLEMFKPLPKVPEKI